MELRSLVRGIETCDGNRDIKKIEDLKKSLADKKIAGIVFVGGCSWKEAQNEDHVFNEIVKSCHKKIPMAFCSASVLLPLHCLKHTSVDLTVGHGQEEYQAFQNKPEDEKKALKRQACPENPVDDSHLNQALWMHLERADSVFYR